MTIKEFYSVVGGDYQDMIGKFMKEERIQKYVLMFPSDDSFKQLEDAMRKRDYDLAFRAVHTLKGVSANLALTPLYNASRVLTELLRANDYRDLIPPYEAVKREYEKVIDAIKKIN